MYTRPRVRMNVDPDLELGAFGINARIEAPDENSQKASTPNTAAAASADVAPPPAAAEPPPAVERTVVNVPVVPPVAPPAAPEPNVVWQVVGPDGPVVLAGARVTMGRGRRNDIVLHDSSVSREHAELVRQGEGWQVRDLGSTNGVLVNGSLVTQRDVRDGDVLLLGNAELRIQLVRQSGGSAGS